MHANAEILSTYIKIGLAEIDNMRVILRDIANFKAEKNCKEEKMKFKVKKVSTRVVRVGPNETMC